MPEILFTEDNEDLRTLSQEILSLGGFKVHAVGSGREALALLRSGMRPACFVLDLGLPDISPEEVCEEFRKISKGVSIPLILASGRSDLEEWAQRFGAARILRKPYDFDALLALAAEYSATTASE